MTDMTVLFGKSTVQGLQNSGKARVLRAQWAGPGNVEANHESRADDGHLTELKGKLESPTKTLPG